LRQRKQLRSYSRVHGKVGWMRIVVPVWRDDLETWSIALQALRCLFRSKDAWLVPVHELVENGAMHADRF
jgi:hypothetical protein